MIWAADERTTKVRHMVSICQQCQWLFINKVHGSGIPSGKWVPGWPPRTERVRGGITGRDPEAVEKLPVRLRSRWHRRLPSLRTGWEDPDPDQDPDPDIPASQATCAVNGLATTWRLSAKMHSTLLGPKESNGIRWSNQGKQTSTYLLTSLPGLQSTILSLKSDQ